MLSVWNFVSLFFVESKTFSVSSMLLSVYLGSMSFMIYMSWTAHTKFLVYFSFMQSHIPKSLFLLFCACMTLPGSDGDSMSSGPTGDKTLSYFISITLIVAALLQLLKLFNKNEEATRLEERERYDQEQAFKRPIS